MSRRKFITALGALVAWPLLSHAQQPSLPVIGFLSSISPRNFTDPVAAFKIGLRTHGYIEGQNVLFEYRWAEGHYEDLEELATQLVNRGVSLIVGAGGVVAAEGAKKITTTIPILFISGFDPVQLGLVASLNKPGGNLTGVSIMTTELAQKRMEILSELLPDIKTAAALVNPGSAGTRIEVKDLKAAADQFGLHFLEFRATTEEDLATALRDAKASKVGALLISADPFFTSRREQIIRLVDRHALPTMYPWRVYAERGGLISYGPDLKWAYRQIGEYAGRILKGTKPSELPIQQPTTFDFVINMNTAKGLGIEVSPLMQLRAHAVIE